MDFGVAIFPTDEMDDPAALGRMAEERGFESIWFPEHTHIPTSEATPHPAGRGLPEEYKRTYDLFVAMTAAAMATTTLRVGSGICLVIERDAIVTAKQVASLDRISGGRVLFGIGAGWNIEEMANHGTDPSTRFGRMRESVEAMTAIWTQDEAEYHGTHVDFDPIWCWPKPVQQPRPPVLVGGNGKGVLDRVLRYGDEWIPNGGGDDERIIARIAKLQSRAREETDRTSIPVTLFGNAGDPATFARYEEAGMTRLVFWLPSVGGDALERAFDDAVARRAALAPGA